MKHNNSMCIYCKQRRSTKKGDHIPAKSLFSDRKFLITVPACEICNMSASKDDEYFRNFVSLRAGGEFGSKFAFEKSILKLSVVINYLV